MFCMTRNAPCFMDLMIDRYIWVRPAIRPWVATLRNPTSGRLLEFLKYQDVGCVLVDSRKGQQLLRRWA
jgi:hypothetical protein